MIEAFPLCWPIGRKRCERHQREQARFKMSFARGRDEIVRQIELLTGSYPWMKRDAALIISTNVPLRRDGLPYALQRQPEDPGVAVYFTYKKQQMCFACDRWQKVEDNMQAIAKTIDALRGVARWGTGDMMEAAFTGFTALPAPGQASAKSWRDILGHDVTTIENLEKVYKHLRSKHHPDKGGRSENFHAVQIAYEQARQELS